MEIQDRGPSTMFLIWEKQGTGTMGKSKDISTGMHPQGCIFENVWVCVGVCVSFPIYLGLELVGLWGRGPEE